MKVYETTGTGPIASFLRDSGLDGEMIPVDDWNTEGYLRVHLSPEGNAKFWGQNAERGPVTEYRDWPKGFDIAKWREIVGEG